MITDKQRKRWGALVRGVNWLCQHTVCANRYRGTDVHYQLEAPLDAAGKIIDEPMPVDCPYCKIPAEPATGDQVYPNRPDLSGVRLYRCGPCRAQVGCHKGTWRPLGTSPEQRAHHRYPSGGGRAGSTQ